MTTTETMTFALTDILSIVPGDSCGDDVKMWFEKMSEVLGSPKMLDSIERDGIINPVVVDFENGMIRNGHHRVAAAILLGIATLPVHSYEAYDWRNSNPIEWSGPVDDLPGSATYVELEEHYNYGDNYDVVV